MKARPQPAAEGRGGHLMSLGEIVARLVDDIDRLVPHLLPAGRREGAEWVEASTRHGGLGDSMSVRMTGPRAGLWAHFAAGKRGDLLDLIGYLACGGDNVAAIRWARDWLGLSGGGGGALPEARAGQATKAAEQRKRDGARDRSRRAAHAQALWLSAPMVEPGDAVDRYLTARGIGLLQLGRRPGCLKAGQQVRYRDDTRWPAMLAAIVGLDGGFLATHRTFLTEDGAKAPLDPAKMVLGEYHGGHIPLWKGTHRQTLRELPEGVPLFVSEGIEDGLSAARLLPAARVVAAVALSNIGALALPPQVRELVLIGQNDPPASKAAEGFAAACRRHAEQGRTVRVARPPEHIKDFNDWVRMADHGG